MCYIEILSVLQQLSAVGLLLYVIPWRIRIQVSMVSPLGGQVQGRCTIDAEVGQRDVLAGVRVDGLQRDDDRLS